MLHQVVLLVPETWGCHVSESIEHLKTAGAADIEMGVFFLCEVGAFSCERKDVQEMNVTFCCERIVTSTLYTILLEFLHYLPPRLLNQRFLWRKSMTN